MQLLFVLLFVIATRATWIVRHASFTADCSTFTTWNAYKQDACLNGITYQCNDTTITEYGHSDLLCSNITSTKEYATDQCVSTGNNSAVFFCSTDPYQLAGTFLTTYYPTTDCTDLPISFTATTSGCYSLFSTPGQFIQYSTINANFTIGQCVSNCDACIIDYSKQFDVCHTDQQTSYIIAKTIPITQATTEAVTTNAVTTISVTTCHQTTDSATSNIAIKSSFCMSCYIYKAIGIVMICTLIIVCILVWRSTMKSPISIAITVMRRDQV